METSKDTKCARYVESDGTLRGTSDRGARISPGNREYEHSVLRKLNVVAKPRIKYLDVQGSITEDDKKRLAVVGSRQITDYGRRVCRDIVSQISSAGVTVVSGLMYGVDLHAHNAALNAGARTIAVLGYGINHLEKNRYAKDVANRIIDTNSGAIISEYKPDQPADRWTFPRRNRIVASIADAVLVVEAGEKSGSRITADFALEMGKDVFVIPGNIYNKTSKGCNDLIKEGAMLVDSAGDVLEMMGVQAKGVREVKQMRLKAKGMDNFSEVEKSIVGLLIDNNESIDIDEFASNIDAKVSDLLLSLTNLELKGVIEKNGKGGYILV